MLKRLCRECKNLGTYIRGQPLINFRDRIFFFALPLFGFIYLLLGGVSVECQDQIVYSAGCRLEKHSVECRLGIITLSFGEILLMSLKTAYDCM